jgi:hypothetical protein
MIDQSIRYLNLQFRPISISCCSYERTVPATPLLGITLGRPVYFLTCEVLRRVRIDLGMLAGQVDGHRAQNTERSIDQTDRLETLQLASRCDVSTSRGVS